MGPKKHSKYENGQNWTDTKRRAYAFADGREKGQKLVSVESARWRAMVVCDMSAGKKQKTGPNQGRLPCQTKTSAHRRQECTTSSNDNTRHHLFYLCAMIEIQRGAEVQAELTGIILKPRHTTKQWLICGRLWIYMNSYINVNRLNTLFEVGFYYRHIEWSACTVSLAKSTALLTSDKLFSNFFNKHILFSLRYWCNTGIETKIVWCGVIYRRNS